MNTFLLIIVVLAVLEYYLIFRQAQPEPSQTPWPRGGVQRGATPRGADR